MRLWGIWLYNIIYFASYSGHRSTVENPSPSAMPAPCLPYTSLGRDFFLLTTASDIPSWGIICTHCIFSQVSLHEIDWRFEQSFLLETLRSSTPISHEATGARMGKRLTQNHTPGFGETGHHVSSLHAWRVSSLDHPWLCDLQVQEMIIYSMLVLIKHKTYQNALDKAFWHCSLLDTSEWVSLSKLNCSPRLLPFQGLPGAWVVIYHFSPTELNLFATCLKSLSSVLIPTAMDSASLPLCSLSHLPEN